MNRVTLVAAVAAALSLAGCRSAFAPPPVLHVSAAPAAEAPATLVREAALRTGPDALAHQTATLGAGTAVTASDQAVRGFRRVRTADGRSGYVEDAAVRLGQAAATAPAPAAQPPAAAQEPAPAEPSAAQAPAAQPHG